MDNKFYICGNINIFGYMGAWGGGGGGFNNQTGPFLVHIYPIFNNNLQQGRIQGGGGWSRRTPPPPIRGQSSIGVVSK